MAALNMTGAAPAEPEPPVVLPKVTVTAQVPLVKVAEFRMREHRYAPAAVTDGRYIYIIGGHDDKGNVLDTVERFDPRTGVSEDFAKLHKARFWHQAVWHQGKIYVLGGSMMDSKVSSQMSPPPPFIDDLRASPTARAQTRIDDREELERISAMEHLASGVSMEIIDLATRQVTPGPAMPDPRSQFGCVTLGGELYVIGGRKPRAQGFSWSNTVPIYSMATGQWRNGLPMPTPRGATQGAVVAGPFIVVPGGFNGQRVLDNVEAFNPRENAWIILPPLCRDSSAHAVVFMGNYLFLFGNYEAPGELIAYDLRTKKSEAFTLQYTPARNAAAVVLDGKIYVIGGRAYKYTEELDCIQVFAPPPKNAAP
jgi:hypothetical protein